LLLVIDLVVLGRRRHRGDRGGQRLGFLEDLERLLQHRSHVFRGFRF